MTPMYAFTGDVTFDLTAGKIHRLTSENGEVRIVAMFPKTYTKHGEKQKLTAINGQEVYFQGYLVTEWDEIELKPA